MTCFVTSFLMLWRHYRAYLPTFWKCCQHKSRNLLLFIIYYYLYYHYKVEAYCIFIIFFKVLCERSCQLLLSWLNLRLWTAKRTNWIGALKNLTKFTGKHLCRNVLFLIKLQAWGLQLYGKIFSDTGVFLFVLWNFEEHLRSTPAIY